MNSAQNSSLPDETARLNGPASDLASRAMAGVRSAMPYLSGLNPEQRQAVEVTDGPILVLAGAGTGKTRVLTSRIAHLISTQKARPFDILSVTFTNKAAREMKERITHVIGSAAEGMKWLGTFHAIGTKILRRHAELVGLKSDFTILDTDDQIRLLKQLIRANDIDDKRWPARLLASAIDGWKNRGLTPDKVPAGDASAYAFGKGGLIYKEYQERLKTLNAVDFGDLLLECLRLWRENPDVLAQYQERFRYILVDEYQDTNVAQYLWLRLLAQKHKNICCVGDDDQSIYGWRGAEVDNILRFEHDFPGAHVVRLERNYRSTKHILSAASHLIAQNEGRLGKTLRTEDEDGEKVGIIGAWDQEEEARLIGEEIESLQHKGHALDQIAVLVRISAQMREIEDRFVTLGLPYRVVGGPRFYERAEIRDALAYLRCVANPVDDLAFERIINVPKRGLGDATLQTLHTYARSSQTSMMQAAWQLIETEELKPRARATLREFVQAFARWSAASETLTQSELAEQVLDESGYTEMWKLDKSPDAAGRLENLKEFVRSMEDFPDLSSFLEHVSLVMEANEGSGGARVSLMTLHAAKGLEFDTVFLPGWEEGLFPSPRAIDETGRAGLEEERRLAHVGLTRARKKARISFAANRRLHGMWNASVPSRFVNDLPEANVEVLDAPSYYGTPHAQTRGGRFQNQGYGGQNYGSQNTSRFEQNQSWKSGGQPPSSHRFQGGVSKAPYIEGQVITSSTASSGNFSVGARVFHVKFGPGSVVDVEGPKLTVDFDKAGRKMVLESFVQAS
jgi:DNA helicase II / ATP-dependent DNA helicase PcrA